MSRLPNKASDLEIRRLSRQLGEAAAAAITDHGGLTGLADDDHPQYLNNARGDVRYAPVAHVGAGGTAHADATTSVSGFMSAADKTKLDGVAAGATATPLSSTTPAALGTAAVGTGTTAARADHVHPLPTTTLTGDLTGSGAGSVPATVANNAISNAKLADVPTATIKGRATAGTGDPEDLTAAQARTVLNVADGATANATDAALRDRATHTGTQAISTVTDLQAALDAKLDDSQATAAGLAVLGAADAAAQRSLLAVAPISAGTVTGRFARWDQTGGSWGEFDLLGASNTWTGANTYTQNVTIGDGTTTRNLTVQGATSGADSGAFVGVRLGSTGFVYPGVIGNRSAIIGGAYSPQGILWSTGTGLPFDVVCGEGFTVNGNTVWHAGNSAQVQAGTANGQLARWNNTAARYEPVTLNTLADAADDSAAATAGVAVGGLYRTGSILKTRIA